jgi:hypothetical protein
MADSRDKYRAIVERPRWTEAEGRIAVDAWRRSGQSLDVFSRKSGISTWRLKAWSKRLDSGRPDKPSSSGTVVRGRSRSIDLVPAVMTSASGGTPAVVIRLPDGLEVEVRDERVDAKEPGRLVAELRRGGA